MPAWFTRRAGTILCLLLALGVEPPGGRAQLLAPVEGPAASLERPTVSAAGPDAVELSVRRFGRYTITVTSDQGVAVELVRRMAGPGERDGEPGERDGRLDVMLERGTYLVRTTGHPKAHGRAKLDVVSFRELNSEQLPRLVPLRPVDTTLEDGTQRSWWLKIEKQTNHPLILEAAGRALADLSLWRDGVWRTVVRTERRTVQPRQGRPLRVIGTAAELPPGLYLVTCSGGPPEPWAGGEDDAAPLHLRLGIPELPADGRSRHEVSPFGFDRWMLPGAVRLVRVDIPEPAPLTVRAAAPWENRIEGEVLDEASIGTKSRRPVARLRPSGPVDEPMVVTVEGAEGQPYLLQHLDRTKGFTAPAKRVWVSVLRTGNPGDTAPVTAAVLHTVHDHQVPLAAAAVVVGPDRSWHGRFNLPERVQVLVWAERPGSYRLRLGGTEAEAVMEPFPVPRDRHFRRPRARRGESEWNLEQGLARLTLDPVTAGIVTVDLEGVRLGDPVAPSGSGPVVVPAQDRITAQLGALDLSPGEWYAVETGRVPDVETGTVMRPLPADISVPLPLALEPGTSVELPVTLAETCELRATAEDGELVPLFLDGTAPRKRPHAAAGRHTVRLRGPRDRAIFCSLEAIPVRLLAGTPLPPLPQAVLDARPKLPELRVGEPSYFELAARSELDLLVPLERSGDYTITSTGLLDTTGTLRDRTGQEIASDDDSGAGRNFFLGAALESGLYGLHVETLGRSAGDFGVTVRLETPVDGGELAPGAVRRMRLEPGRGLAYTVRIPEPGRYRLETLSLSGTPPCRLEDGRGWPLERPGIPARFERDFEAGTLRLELLPARRPRTLVTVFRHLEAAPSFQGHGPHPLPLDSEVHHIWREPQAGARRTPDVWTFELPAPATVHVALSRGVTGRIMDAGGAEAGTVTGGVETVVALPAGRHRLEVEAAIPDDRLPYTVRVTPEELLPGMRRRISAPGTLALSLPAGVADIETLGGLDTAARLLDSDGHELAASDDRPGDWNPGFLLPLPAGRYTVELETLAGSGPVEVSLDMRPERTHPPATPPTHVALGAGRTVEVIPLRAQEGSILLAEARADARLALELEAQEADGTWRAVGGSEGRTAALEAVVGSRPLRLRLWSAGGGASAADLSLALARPETASLRHLRRGLTPAPPPRSALATAVAALDLGGPGVLVLDRTVTDLRATDRPDTALRAVTGRTIPTATGRLWLAVPRAVELRADRLRLGAEPVELELPAGGTVTVDLDPARTFSLVLASSRAGTPLLAAGDDDFTACSPLDGASALAVAPGVRSLRVRLGEAGAGGLVRLILRPAPAGASLEPHGPAVRLDVPAGGVTVRLAGGRAAWRVVTGPGVAAAPLGDGGPLLTLGGGDAPAVTEFNGSFDAVLFLPAGETPGVAELRRLPEGSLPENLAPGRPVALATGTPGRLRLPVDVPGGTALHTAGRGVSARLVTPGGRLLESADLEHGAAGVLWLDHGGGAAAAWAGKLDGVFADTAPARACDPPCREASEGASLALALAPAAPEVAALQLPAGCAFRLVQDNRTVSAFVGDTAPRHLYLDASPATLTVRSLLPGGRAGIELTTWPVRRAGEGLGAPVLLGPGESVAFRFTVAAATDVGMGVRAVPDTVHARLLDGRGAVLGEGIVQMHHLDPGDYLLLVSQPAGAGPVTVRPALAGLEPPPAGPPAQAVRHYLELSGRIK